MEHERKGTKGEVIEKVDKEKLEEIAKEMNARDKKGQLCPLTFGHTNDSEDETKQPPHEGYGRHFKVVWDESKKKWVIKATYYIRGDRYEEAKTYPNVSPEYWPKDKILAPISLLRREPKLDLGQWVYGKQGRVVRYMMESDMAEERKPIDDRGAHPAATDPAERGDPPAHGAEKGGPMVSEHPEGVEPEFHEKFIRCMDHYHKCGMHHKYMAMYPSATNGTVGGAGVTKVPAGGEVPARMSKSSDKPTPAETIRIAELERQLEEHRGRLAVQEKRARLERYEKNLLRLQGVGYEFDVGKLLKRCDERNYDDNEFNDLIADIKVNYRRTAGHRGDVMIDTAVGSSGLSMGSAAQNQFKEDSRDDFEVAQKYMRDRRKETGKDPSWEECKIYAVKQRTSR